MASIFICCCCFISTANGQKGGSIQGNEDEEKLLLAVFPDGSAEVVDMAGGGDGDVDFRAAASGSGNCRRTVVGGPPLGFTPSETSYALERGFEALVLACDSAGVECASLSVGGGEEPKWEEVAGPFESDARNYYGADFLLARLAAPFPYFWALRADGSSSRATDPQSGVSRWSRDGPEPPVKTADGLTVEHLCLTDALGFLNFLLSVVKDEETGEEEVAFHEYNGRTGEWTRRRSPDGSVRKPRI